MEYGIWDSNSKDLTFLNSGGRGREGPQRLLLPFSSSSSSSSSFFFFFFLFLHLTFNRRLLYILTAFKPPRPPLPSGGESSFVEVGKHCQHLWLFGALTE